MLVPIQSDADRVKSVIREDEISEFAGNGVFISDGEIGTVIQKNRNPSTGKIHVPRTAKLSKVSSGALKKIKKVDGTVIEKVKIKNEKLKMEGGKKRSRLPGDPSVSLGRSAEEVGRIGGRNKWNLT